ncbi:MAG: signal peptidase II [Candidatus Doudnabacteria bacterium]
MRKLKWCFALAGGLFILDQILKNWAGYVLAGGPNFFILGHFFSLEFYRNYGIAFGIPLPALSSDGAGPAVFFYSIAALLCVFLYYWGRKFLQRKDFSSLCGLVLLGAGAFSNALDRLRFGYVIDYLNLAFWPVFNVADIMIVAGVVILLVKAMRKQHNEK